MVSQSEHGLLQPNICGGINFDGHCISTIYTHIYDEFLRPKNEAETRGSSYIRVHKCTGVNGHQVADLRSNLGGRLKCEVAL